MFFVFPAEAYDALDPNGNITIKWDVITWTPDGYVVCLSFVIITLLHLECESSRSWILKFKSMFLKKFRS